MAVLGGGFFSAFRWRPFRFLAAIVMLQTVWINLQTLFYIYWFEDLIAPNFTVAGHHLTNSSQSALAISQSITAAGSFVFALPGGWLGDRFGPRTVLICTGFVTCVCPLLNAFLPTFNCVLGVSALNGVVAGLASGSGGALQANCLPVHPQTGRPLNAARDMMLIGAMNMVTGAIVPTVLGHAFVLFTTKTMACECCAPIRAPLWLLFLVWWYFWWSEVCLRCVVVRLWTRADKTFFLSAAAIHAFSVCLYFWVDPVAEQRRVLEEASADIDDLPLIHATSRPSAGMYDTVTRSVPLGARVCDWLLWSDHQGENGRRTHGRKHVQ